MVSVTREHFEVRSGLEAVHLPTGAVFRAYPYSNPEDMLRSIQVQWGRAGSPPLSGDDVEQIRRVASQLLLERARHDMEDRLVLHAAWDIADRYKDLGATAIDSAGHDLGVKTFLNGLLASNIVLDTSTTSTDTIDYVATDTWGQTATATRTVIIIDAPPNLAASTTESAATATQ